MTTALHFALALFWAVWLGAIILFSFVVAPTVHGVLEKQDAARLLRNLFPRYYALGIVCGAAGILTGLAAGADLRVTAPLVIATVLTAYARQVLAPALDAARSAADDDTFERLHVTSVRMNLVVLAMLLLAGTVIAGGQTASDGQFQENRTVIGAGHVRPDFRLFHRG